MPTGIDVGARTLRVSTPEGTTRHENGIRRTDGTDSGAGDAPTVETDDAVYAVGGGDGTRVGRLLGDSEVPERLRGEAAEALLGAVAPDEDRLRYVAWGAGGADPLGTVATGLGYDAAAVDPGLAVCYDAFDAPATGLGVAVGETRAVATLATAGVPVATASVDVDGDWYDIADTEQAHGPAEEWRRRQYEALCGDLADAIAPTAPALADRVPVAFGGEASPDDPEGLADALGSALGFEVGPVTVVDDPAAALARGALVAAEADDGTEPPLPTFGADVPFVGALADFGAATGALATGATVDGPGRAGDASGTTDDGATAATAGTDLATLERRGVMTARGVSDLVDRLENGGAGDGELRAELDSLAERVPDEATLETLERDLAGELESLRETLTAVEADVERLDEGTASASAVADLTESLATLEADVADLESDTERLRAVLAGLDEDSDLDAPDVGGVEQLQVEALQDDIDDLETTLDDRVEGLWTELDDLSDRLVDVEATAEDVPDLEETVGSVRNAVDDLEAETASVADSVEDLRASFEDHAETAATDGDVAAVEADIERLADDVEALRREFEETERVDPEDVAALETDLDGLRQTLITRADRLEAVEEANENLRDRIETVYQNSAKSEALSSLQTETSRVRQSAAEAMERANEMTETVSELDETVDAHEEQLGMLSTNVDNLAGSSVTRSEMDARVERVEDRLDEFERDIRSELDGVRELASETDVDVEPVEDDDTENLVVTLQASAFVGIGLVGAVLSVLSGFPLVAGAFLVFAVMPGVLSWLVS